MRASARSAASYEDSRGRSIVALQKLSLKHDQEIRELAGALTDFLLAPKAVKAGMEAGVDCVEEVKKRGRGHGLGAPYTHVAAPFVGRGRGGAQASADDILGARSSEAVNSDRVLWSVQGERGVLSERTPSSTAQGEGDDGVQRARSAGRRARGKGCGASNRTDAESERGRDGSGRRSEDRAGEVSEEAVARPAVCTAEVMERLRMMARTSVVAARMLANEDRQFSRGYAAPQSRQAPLSQSA